MVWKGFGETEAASLELLSAGVCEDLQTSPSVLDDLLHGESLELVELLLGQTEGDTLLQGEEEAGGGQEAGSPVGEEVLHTGVGDDALCHPPQLAHVHSLGEVEPGYDVVQVVHGRRAGQFPP